MTPPKKRAAQKAAATEEPGPGAEANDDRGPGPEHAETLVSVHDTPVDDQPLEED